MLLNINVDRKDELISICFLLLDLACELLP